MCNDGSRSMLVRTPSTDWTDGPLFGLEACFEPTLVSWRGCQVFFLPAHPIPEHQVRLAVEKSHQRRFVRTPVLASQTCRPRSAVYMQCRLGGFINYWLALILKQINVVQQPTCTAKLAVLTSLLAHILVHKHGLRAITFGIQRAYLWFLFAHFFNLFF